MSKQKDVLGKIVRLLVAIPSCMLGIVHDLLEKLSGEQGSEWFSALKKFLRKENPWPKIVETAKKLETIPFYCTEFIGKGWGPWRGLADGNGLEGEEDVDLRSLALTEVEISKMNFETCLKEGEMTITGEEKPRRLKKVGGIRLCGNVFLALWRDYEANKEKSVIEELYRTRGISYLDFMGLVLRGPSGRRCVLYLRRDVGGGWDWGFRWLGRDWDDGNFSAVYVS